MNVSSTGLSRLGKAKALTLAALVAAFGMLALAGSSKAAPVDHTITIDKGKLTLGAVFPNNTIIPADVPGPLTPLINNGSPNGEIKVTVDGSAASVTAANFKIPAVWVPKPGDPNTHVPILVKAPNGLTGTFDSGTGALDLTGDLRISVVTGIGATPPYLETCNIDATGVKWSTGLNPVTPGVPFTTPQGLDGNGAISASWSDLPNGTEDNGGDCSTVNAVIHDTGAIWFSNGIADPPPAPVCEPPLEGLWPDCEEPPAPPVVKKAKITKVAVSNGKVKAGKKVKLTVKVTNKGDAAAKNVKVTLKSSNKQVKIAKSVTIKNIAPGKTAAVKVVVKTTKKAKGKATITAKAAGKSGKGKVTVQKAKKKRK
ncbi:MAG: NEW3 domain-containing protein [Solirubrobacterales bacterium]|nr:NEW3 domain-containing protein [Solirubrobacterales bacterium]